MTEKKKSLHIARHGNVIFDNEKWDREHDASIRYQILEEAIEEIGKLSDLIYLGEDNKTEITLADGIWRDDVINTLERMKQ